MSQFWLKTLACAGLVAGLSAMAPADAHAAGAEAAVAVDVAPTLEQLAPTPAVGTGVDNGALVEEVHHRRRGRWRHRHRHRRWHRHRRHRHHGRGAGLFFGGVVAGAIIANRHRYYDHGYYDDRYYGRRYCNYDACAHRYRSFRPSDCSFQPYHGPRRYCPL